MYVYNLNQEKYKKGFIFVFAHHYSARQLKSCVPKVTEYSVNMESDRAFQETAV